MEGISSKQNRGRWTSRERDLFVKGLQNFGKDWRQITHLIGTRSIVQVRTHAQKFFQQLAKETGGPVISTSKKDKTEIPATFLPKGLSNLATSSMNNSTRKNLDFDSDSEEEELDEDNLDEDEDGSVYDFELEKGLKSVSVKEVKKLEGVEKFDKTPNSSTQSDADLELEDEEPVVASHRTDRNIVKIRASSGVKRVRSERERVPTIPLRRSKVYLELQEDDEDESGASKASKMPRMSRRKTGTNDNNSLKKSSKGSGAHKKKHVHRNGSVSSDDSYYKGPVFTGPSWHRTLSLFGEEVPKPRMRYGEKGVNKQVLAAATLLVAPKLQINAAALDWATATLAN